jgi:tetratricopeptide (TPR) repeat protein
MHKGNAELAALFFATSFAVSPAMAIDINALWNFNNPALSEQNFRAALATVEGDDALILQTQIARSHGLRKDFSTAQAVLREVQAKLVGAGFEARVRYWLELGRTYSSATHTPASQTPAVKDQARAAYAQALALAKQGQLDGLAVDTIHMLAFVDTAPADALKWALEALAVVQASKQPAAQAWEGSIRNNMGVALHQLGRYDEALVEFQKALVEREKAGKPERVRVAHWMIAWTLRALNRAAEAINIQLRLERENAAAGQPDVYVFEELEILYRAQGDAERAAHYAKLRAAAPV